jgi:hypothetical protein
MKKMNTLIGETIHIKLKCVMHWNKMVPFMNPSILVDFSNGAKFVVTPTS